MKFANLWPLRAALAAMALAGATAVAGQDTASGPAKAGQAPDAVKPPEIATAAFANRNQMAGARISPDGNKLLMRIQKGGKTLLAWYDANSRKPLGSVVTSHDGPELEWYRWAGNEKVIFSISMPGTYFGEDVRATRLVGWNIITDELFYVGLEHPTVIGDDVLHVAEDGSSLLLAAQRSAYDWPQVYQFAIEKDAKPVTVQQQKDGVWNWYADTDGVVRVGTAWTGDKLRIYYRASADDKLRLIGKLEEGDEESSYWDVSRIVSGSDEGYIRREDENGRIALVRFNYATREVVETVYANLDWDVTDILYDQHNRPLAAYYTDDRDRIVWFDDRYATWQKKLERALPEETIWMTSTARDASRVLVYAGGAADPGALYIFTPGENRVEVFGQFRPSIDHTKLAMPHAFDIPTRDGHSLRSYLTLPRGRDAKALPLIILPHGGPYGVRDKLEYNDEVQLLANRGYAVLQPNFRGSDGFGESFEDLGANQIGRAMQDDLDDAMDWAVKEGFADPARVCLVGSSYGGYAAMWGVIRNPERYRCAASFAGVSDWDKQLAYDSRYFSRKGSRKWKERVRGEQDMDAVSPYRQGERLSRPLLLAHGKEDSNVPFSQYRNMERATRNTGQVETLVFEEEGHGFTRAESEQQWYDALLAFLAKHNPAD